VLPILSFAGPGGQVEIRIELPARADAPVADRVPDADDLPEDPPLDDDIPPAEPADTSPSEHDAEDSEPPVESDEPAAAASLIRPANLVWGTLTAISVGLAVFALIITVLALSGLDRLF
jgi:hypothetical protein